MTRFITGYNKVFTVGKFQSLMSYKYKLDRNVSAISYDQIGSEARVGG